LNAEPSYVTVHIKHKDSEETFSGTPEQVWQLLNKFFNQFMPTFEIAQKLSLKTDVQSLVKESENLIGITEEGPHILVSRNCLTDNETLALVLLGQYIAGSDEPGLSKENLQAKLGKDAKITSTRLGELVKNELAAKTVDDKYRITTFGLAQMQKEILPRIRSKAGL